MGSYNSKVIYPIKTYMSDIKFLSLCVSHNEIFCSTLTKKRSPNPLASCWTIEVREELFIMFSPTRENSKVRKKVDEIRCNIAINAIGRSAIFLRGQVKKNIERLSKERWMAINFLKAPCCSYELGAKTIYQKCHLLILY